MDDGSCQYHQTISQCLKRKSLMDDTKSYCRWVVNKSTNVSQCEYAPVSYGFKVSIIQHFIVIFN